MGTYYIPRNVKGEGRILFIFSKKALIYTTIGAGIGLLFYFIFASLLGWIWVGIGAVVLFAAVGFGIGTFKIPNINKFELTRQTGGENIDDIILRAIQFKRKKKIYINEEEDTKDE